MNIVLLIFMIIGAILSVSIFLPTMFITKNNENFEEFYNHFLESSSMDVPEEVIYRIVYKIKLISGALFVIFFAVSILLLYSIIR